MMLKITLLLAKMYFFSLNEGISELVAWVAPKHSATDF